MATGAQISCYNEGATELSITILCGKVEITDEYVGWRTKEIEKG